MSESELQGAMVSLPPRETCDTASFQRLASLLKQCGAMKDLTQGKQIHSYIIRTGLHNNLLLNNLLLQMYLSCGSVVDVHDAFLGMYQKNKFSWNFYITSHARHGQHNQVMYAFYQMLCECLLPNEFIFVGTISSCARNSALQDGKHMHARVIRGHGTESNNIVIENALVNMYCRCNIFMESKRIFNEMQVKNVVTWTDMILACAHHEGENYSIVLYKQMHQEGVIANKVTFINILEACASHQWPIEGKQIHVSIIGNRLESEDVLNKGMVTWLFRSLRE